MTQPCTFLDIWQAPGYQSLPDLGDDKVYDTLPLPPQFTLLPVPCGNLAASGKKKIEALQTSASCKMGIIILIRPVSQSCVFDSDEVCSEFKEKAIRDKIMAIVPIETSKNKCIHITM